MARVVSSSDLLLFLLVTIALPRFLTFPNVKAVAFSMPSYEAAVDPFSNYTCPSQCECFKVNETTSRPSAWINCTVDNFSSSLWTTHIRDISNPLTGYLLFTCDNSGRYEHDPPQESILWEGAFQRLPRLRTLVFDRCRFRKLSKIGLSGLLSLTKLIIRGAAINDLDPDLLAYIPQLDVLELSKSSLTQLLPLCSARSLRVLNVSGNHLISLEDTGLHCLEGQTSRLETLDISNNFLTEVPGWLAQSLPNLYHLGLSNNLISRTGQSPFRSLNKLTFLDISNNSFTSFPSNFFKGCSNLRLLDFSWNKVFELPRGLVSNLSALQHLKISKMGVNDKIWMEISELRQLIHLNMSNNKVTAIDINVMSHLVKLENLYLNNNQISSLPRSAFEYQNTLNTLDLSGNHIPDIPSHAFRSQSVLKHLYLQNNKITSIGYDAFSQLSELLAFDLSHNNISVLPARTFNGLTKLTHFDISRNNLTFIDSDTFSKTSQISYLNLSYNNLPEVLVFNQLHNLRTIDLSHNMISYLNPSFILDLRDLTTLLLGHNQLKMLPLKIFKGCQNIRTIDLSNNFLKVLDESTFSSISHLQTLNVSHNEIADIGTGFSGLKDLETLDLSYNKIDKVLRGQFPHFISHLNLRGNQIMFITAHTFKSLNRIQTVDLSFNKLPSLTRMDVEIAFNMEYTPLFNLQFNPFVCDCHLGWLKNWSLGKLKDIKTIPNFVLDSGLGCSNPFYNSPQTLQKLSRTEFLCEYSSHCEDSCMCCDYACYCKYVCPASCHCYIGDDYLQVHYVQCNSANLTSVPSELPEGATNLRLDGNNIQVLHRHEFLALKHVEYLHLNHCNINTIENNTFKGLKSVRLLYLNNNRITSLYTVTFQGLDNLEELYLQNNEIYFLDFDAFLILSLRVINLQNNALRSVSVEDLTLLANHSLASDRQTRMFLSDNPWSCGTNFSCGFLLLVLAHREFVADASYIECFHDDITVKSHTSHLESSLLLDLSSELCGNNQSSHINCETSQGGCGNDQSPHQNMTWQNVNGSPTSSPSPEIYAFIAAGIIILFTITLFIVAYINRNFLQMLFYTRFGFRIVKMATPLDDLERPYDAFICYSNKDEDFVLQQLAPRLEHGDKKYKLCVHYRDFPAGVCMTECIVRSVEASKRTVLVVSDNFMDSEWCRFEFQTAHQQVLNDRRYRVIVILLHDLDEDKIDDSLKAYMRTQTCLRYEDPWFWKKLMFAMPEVRRKKSEMPSPLPSARDFEYMTNEGHFSGQQLYPRFQINGRGNRCETIRNFMYETPVFDSPSVHYHLANSHCCSTHTNSAYHNSDGSDSTTSYHKGSLRGSCCHYEEVGPGSTSSQGTPLKQFVNHPPPVPSIPKEGFVPRQKLMTWRDY